MIRHTGFSDPARDAARCFRAVLEAMARPGLIARVPAGPACPPLSPAAAAALLTLCDADAPAWIAPPLACAAVDGFLRLRAGAPASTDPEACAFALGPWAALAERPWRRGAPERPDLGVTLIVETDALGEGETITLEGPGVDGRRSLAVAGLDARFAALLDANRATAPLGLDVLLTAGDRLAALPRSARRVV